VPCKELRKSLPKRGSTEKCKVPLLAGKQLRRRWGGKHRSRGSAGVILSLNSGSMLVFCHGETKESLLEKKREGKGWKKFEYIEPSVRERSGKGGHGEGGKS